MKWIKFQVPEELHELFKRAAKLDVDSRSLAHFAQLAMQERMHRLFKQSEWKLTYERIKSPPEEE